MFSSGVEAFKGQKYSALKKQALSSGHLFQDPEFPPNEHSLFYGRGRAEGIVWKRPAVCSFQCCKLLLLLLYLLSYKDSYNFLL